MLKILPQNISNLIAAGEVVSRPSSVVKELVENAIDAGADTVSVYVTDAGRTLVRVVDNGCGMTPRDAELCFERHATSKIASADDLEKIITYGFRGEALPSIAAVAQVTLKTRCKGEEIGTKVEIADSKVISSEPEATPEGTVFDIRNIFFNVPARRKFLKSDNVELRNIVQEFLRVALTRIDITLKLYSNGKELYNLKSANNLKQRILDIHGVNMNNELVEVEVDTSVVKIHGFIGNPEDARKRAGYQYFFVNGRFFRSPFFNKAVCKQYENLIPGDSFPSYFLYLEVEPDKLDVNIHPAKTEVKFEDESVIFEILSACVREGLGKNSFTPSIDFDMAQAPQIPVFHPQESRIINHPKVDYAPLFNPFDVSENSLEQKALFDGAAQTGGNSVSIIILQKKYIVTSVKSGMMVIHIERARQRIFYERYYEKIAEAMPIAQQILFPQTVKLSAEDCQTLEEQSDMVAQLGFDISSFGQNSVVINALPEGYPLDPGGVQDALERLVEGLRDETTIDDSRHIVAVKMAETAARYGKNNMNETQAQLLVDQLFACREPNLSPDGHRCVNIISIDELDKRL